MLKYKGSLRDQWIDYRHWRKNWWYIIKFAMTNPFKVVKALIKFPWIYDMLKANSMVRRYNENRTGTALKLSHMTFSSVINDVILNQLKAFIFDPENTIIIQAMIPNEIFVAMGLKCFTAELPATVLPMVDQHSANKYMDTAENHGLPGDTCSYPRITLGVGLAGHIPKAKCIITSNLPCDGGMSSYAPIENKYNLPTYRLDVPHNFKDEESLDTYVEDLKDMIKFLEKTTGHKMDWNRLKEVCESFNRMNELELEKWQYATLDNPPVANDNIWLNHIMYFNLAPGVKSSTKLYEKQDKIIKKAYERKEPAVKNMQYRAILWNPPTFSYAHFWNWLERCWGIGVLNDLETFGYSDFIDVSSNESMLESLGKRYMYATMARHTRGDWSNYLDDIWKLWEVYKPDVVIMANHIGCRNSMGLNGVLKEECRKRNIPICFFDYELMDSRVTSRQGIRDQISNFMETVMDAEPLDSSLLNINDEATW